jgi:ABC-type dipeptide/oligopeptide/nickel transport system ATPase subunit
LYLLNIIFEIKARENLDSETLFIIDDIADSFDYKNKYAIIQYLNDIHKNDKFYQIILTHNFDFYRTIQSRILWDSKRHNSLIAIKSNEKIELKDF